MDAPQSGPVPSPCIEVCQMDPATDLCEGCGRTLDEITRWSQMTDDEKRRVWDELKKREAAANR